MLNATKIDFLPDAALQFRAIGAGATSSVYTSDPISLNKLAAYWHTNEWGNKTLLVAVGFLAGSFSARQSYDFEVQVDALAAFGSPITVARKIVQGTGDLVNGRVELAVDVANMAGLDANAGFMRLKMTPTGGSDQASIVMVDEFWEPAAEFTLNDGTNGVKPVKVGTPETATVAFSAVADVGDTITINDGVNAPVIFTFAAAGAGLTTVAHGASATASAQNLKTAIEANVAANTLDLSVAGAGATLTITNLAGVTAAIFAASTITKSDADNDYVITDFANGVAGAVQPQSIHALNGGTFETQRTQIVAAINAITPASFSAVLNAATDTILITNSLPNPGTSTGTILEVADAGNSFTVVAFAVVPASVNFWSFVQGERAQ